eukprot:4203765-Prymnesium_polylepis.1
MSELYSNKWMAHFTSAAVERSGDVHRVAVHEEIQRIAERRAASAKVPRTPRQQRALLTTLIR